MSRYTTDPRWKRVRAAKLAQQPTCERCGEPATDVHHKDEAGLDGPAAYSIENAEALCHSCHSKHTARDGVAKKGRRLREPEQHPGLVRRVGRDPLRHV